MPISDQQLFDFNATLMVDYDDEKAHASLETYGDAFRFQLVAALHLSEWAKRLERREGPVETLSDERVEGWVDALENVAAYLRQGYYLPSGHLYQEIEHQTD